MAGFCSPPPPSAREASVRSASARLVWQVLMGVYHFVQGLPMACCPEEPSDKEKVVVTCAEKTHGRAGRV